MRRSRTNCRRIQMVARKGHARYRPRKFGKIDTFYGFDNKPFGTGKQSICVAVVTPNSFHTTDYWHEISCIEKCHEMFVVRLLPQSGRPQVALSKGA